MENIKLMNRDYQIIKEIDRWRITLGRHIKELTGFTGQRACDRRLKKLMDAGYITRKHIIYGVPSIYRLTNKSKLLKPDADTGAKIRVEQVIHDIKVIDTAIHFHKENNIPYSDMLTEKELHKIDGYGNRKHHPDFVYTKDNKKICVEIELSQKSKSRLEANIKSNFMKYDKQIWIVPSFQSKIACILKNNMSRYSNIEIMNLEGTEDEFSTDTMGSEQIGIETLF